MTESLRIQIKLSESDEIIYNDLVQYPRVKRAKRLRYLAMLGLMALEGKSPAMMSPSSHTPADAHGPSSGTADKEALPPEAQASESQPGNGDKAEHEKESSQGVDYNPEAIRKRASKLLGGI